MIYYWPTRSQKGAHIGDYGKSQNWPYGKEPYVLTENSTNSIECLAPKDVLEAAMWWSRERRKEALAQRPHIKEALAEAAPISHEIDHLLRSKGVSVWTAIVTLAASLGTAAAVATSASPLKGYLRVAHHYVDSAFWVAYAEFKHSAEGVENRGLSSIGGIVAIYRKSPGFGESSVTMRSSARSALRNARRQTSPCLW